MKERLLDLLRNAEGYVSGQKICEILGVSRTAVWKYVQQLEKDGYVIDAVRNKGYCLKEGCDILSLYELEHSMETERMGQTLVYADVLDSTNMEAKRQAENGAPEGTLVVADCQEAGRGRLGRTWSSPSGCGLWMSLILRPSFPPTQASMVTLVGAMAVMEGIQETSGIEAMIKWPNDLVVDGKKVCGILTEMSLEEDRIRHIVMGIGINVNNTSFPEELQEKAIAISMITEKKISRAKLAAAVCKSFEYYYQKFLEDGDLRRIIDAYNARLVNRGQQVVISDGTGQFTCVSAGVDATGALLVTKEDGSAEAITSGEVSVRGIYGYV